MDKPLISIIMPNYNSSRFIEEAIFSVLNQTYTNWELIIIDDNSDDNSIDIINNFTLDKRIRIIRNEKNLGGAISRQKGIDDSNGEFITFLDSDDIWLNNKLKNQLAFMLSNSCQFSYTNYTPISEDGKIHYNQTNYKKIMNYYDLLKHSPGNSTVMLLSTLCKQIKIPEIKKRNDYLFFLKLIKLSKHAFLMNEIQTLYRINSKGLSRNKFALIKYHWYIYRKIEKLSFFYSIYLIFYIIIRKLLG